MMIQIQQIKQEQKELLQPNPTSADADDDFGFTTDIEFFEDSKKYILQTQIQMYK